MSQDKKIGVVSHFYNKISVGIVALKAKLKLGDQIHVKGNQTDFTQRVTSMQLEHQDVKEAKKGDEAGVKMEQPVREKDQVFLVEE